MPLTVQFGSFGDTVKLLQQALNIWPKSNLPALTVDGSFGPKTKGKVTEFQSKSSLVPDGVVGPLTWAQLEPLVQAIKGIVPIPSDEPAAGARIVAGAEAALGMLGWTAADAYSTLNPRIAAAKCANDADPSRPRQGGLALAQIFAIAQVPGGYQARCSTISTAAVQMWQQQTQPGTIWRNANDLCAWCGIFTVYVLRGTGFSIPNGWGSQATYVKEAQKAFNQGGGAGSVYRLFIDPAQAFPGCIGVINPSGSNHHFIVTGNKGGVISSIDGNSSGFGLDPDPKKRFDCKSIIGRNTYTHSQLRNAKDGGAYFLFPAPGNR
ncbi:MAG TPA: peptidoglycan-binding domain-containing protein [Vicinamibacterales bacterium]|nr:peptidoglycan-binding domain-containing protein [Vicinamibacterales bacterium]